MSVERIDVNPTYSNIVIHNGTVYLSGQVPWKTAGTDFKAQVNEVFQLIDDRLLDAGSNKASILSMQVFLKDPANYSSFNEEFITWISPMCSPARNTICGIQFPYHSWDLEIVVVAATANLK